MRRHALPLQVLLCALLLPAAAPLAAQAGEPTRTELTVQPALKNPDQAARVLNAVYPPLLRDAGIEGVAQIWIHIDALGRVTDTRIAETSGYKAMDEAAEQVARVMSFEPGRRNADAVPAWTIMNIRFALPAPEPAAPPRPEATAPVQAPAAPATPPAPAPRAASLEELLEQPSMTPSQTEPRVLNGAQAEAAVNAFYPPTLKQAGIGGAPEVWILIGDRGSVLDARVKSSSGYAEIDQAATTVGRTLRFDPATTGGQPVPVWRSITLRFRAPSAAEPAEATAAAAEAPAAEPPAPVVDTTAAAVPDTAVAPAAPAPDTAAAAPAPEPAEAVADDPEFTPFTVRPELQNGDEVQAALAERYPPVLRDAGLGGVVKVWLFIDGSGAVTEARVQESSGYSGLDDAAIQVARIMRYSPAQNEGEAVPVWVSIDLTFESQ